MMGFRTDFNLSGAIVALVTPFDINGKIDFISLEKLIGFHLNNGTSGILICGSTGEAATLSHDEWESLITFSAQKIAGAVHLMVGTGTNDTRISIERSRRAVQLGANSVLVVAPYYNRPTAKGMYLHFSEVAKAVEAPIVLYNVPSRTGSSISSELVVRLADEFENIVGIKEAAGCINSFVELLAKRPDGFKVYSGDDMLAVSANYLGADGCISVVANVLPKEFAEMMTCSMNRNVVEANGLFFDMQKFIQSLFIEINPIPVKTVLAEMNLIGEYFRAPLCPMEENNREMLITELKNTGVLV